MMGERCDECGRQEEVLISIEYKGRKSPKRCPRCQKEAYARIVDAAQVKAVQEGR